MEFTPSNPIVKLCIQGMGMEAKDNTTEAAALFMRAWNEATDDFEKFIAAYHKARLQPDAASKLQWYQMALQLALGVNNEAVEAAFSPLYLNIAQCYEALGDAQNAKNNYDLAESSIRQPTDQGPFYHGTKAQLQPGDMLTPGRISNYDASITMNHIYFTASLSGAGLAASLAKGDGAEHVYMVQPEGGFENDPNVTNQRFPGNPTRSYRTERPLKIVAEITDWARQTPEDLKKWRERLDSSTGKIIN